MLFLSNLISSSFLFFLGSFLLGGLVVFFVMRFRFILFKERTQAESSSSRQALEERLNLREEQLNKLQQEHDQLRSHETKHREIISKLETQLDEQHQNFTEKLQLLEEAKKNLGHFFQTLSQESLKNNNKIFMDLARSELEKQQKQASHELDKRQTSIHELLKPMKEVLDKVENKHNEIDKNLAKTSATLKEHILNLTESNQKLKLETNNLVKALRTPQVRGRWGEMTLKRVAELSGMIEYCDFDEQISHTDEDGTLRPDMIVNLPSGKKIIVDAKTPLQAYLEALETEDEEQLANALSNHARQLKTHMDKLSDKAYWSQFSPTPEFVVLFVPGENFFSAALDKNPQLIEEGISKGVILATPTTLISLLKAVGYGWRQEKLAENAQKISQLGREIYQRLANLSEHFNKLETNLRRSVESYNSAVGTLEGRVLSSARRFRDLGVEAKTEIEETKSLTVSPRKIQADELNLSTLENKKPDITKLEKRL